MTTINKHSTHVVSFSGGKDSTAMLFLMLERGVRIDRIMYVDTTKDFPQMYDHIQEVQQKCPIEIETITVDFDYQFGEHVKTKGKHIGKKGRGWPHFSLRWCTGLKRDALQKLHNSIPGDVVQFHGIAADEQKRCKTTRGRTIRWPLVEWNITEKQALEYCYSLGFTWGGLYEKFHRVSCWCCPFSRIGGLRTLYNDFPELWEELIEMDKKSFRRFRGNCTVTDLTTRFAAEQKAAGGDVLESLDCLQT